MSPQLSVAELHKNRVMVNSESVAYVEMGHGVPVVFIHGNPTSSYIWRNILPTVSVQARCIAVDLIGMGDSARLPDSNAQRYSLADHQSYLDGFLEKTIGKSDAVFVCHGWGSALTFDWVSRHPEQTLGVAYMEAIVAPSSWADWPEGVRGVFQAFRSPAGEQLILEQNAFIEQILPGATLRALSPQEMEAYRRPFRDPGEGRRSMLSCVRQVPVEGEPAEVIRTVQAYAQILASDKFPKLFVNAEPGAILTGPQRETCRRWQRQTEVTVKGAHYVQEDSPLEIAQAIVDWLVRERLVQAVR